MLARRVKRVAQDRELACSGRSDAVFDIVQPESVCLHQLVQHLLRGFVLSGRKVASRFLTDGRSFGRERLQRL